MNKKIVIVLTILVVLCMVSSCNGKATSNELTESVTKATEALKTATETFSDTSKDELKKAQSELESLRAENASIKADAERAASEAQAALEKAQNELKLAQLEAQKAQAEADKAYTEAQAAKVAAAATAAQSSSSKTGAKGTSTNSAPIMSLNMTTEEEIASAVNADNKKQTADLSNKIADAAEKVVDTVNAVAVKADNSVNSVSQLVLTSANNVVSATQVQVSQAADNIGAKIDRISDNVGSAATSLASDTKNAVAAAKEETIKAISTINATAQNAVASAVEAVNTNTGVEVNKAVETINAAVDQAVEAGLEKIKDAFSSMLDEYNIPKKKTAEVVSENTTVETVSKPAKLTVDLTEFNSEMAALEEQHQRILAQQKEEAEKEAKAAAEAAAEKPAPVTFTPDMLRNRTAVTDNYNRVVDAKSDLFAEIQALYIALGLSQPSASGPWTVSELKDMMAGIPAEALKKESVRNLYNNIMEELESKVSFDFGYIKVNLMNVDLSFAVYGRYMGTYASVPSTNARKSEIIAGRFPLVSTGAEIYIGPYAYIKGSIAIKDNTDKDVTETWANNLSFLFDSDNYNSDMIDYSVLASYGLDNFSLIAGHDYLSWNNYKIGSMILSPVTKLNFVQTSFYGKSIDFTFTEANKESFWVTAAKAELNRKGRLNLGLSFVNAYKNIFNVFQTPVIGFDVDFALCNNFNVYAQAAVTTEIAQFQGYGVMAGYKWIIPANHGVFTVSTEAQYMAKRLYSDSFYFVENEANTFNNPAKFVLAPKTDKFVFDSKTSIDDTDGALNNFTNSFATLDGALSYSNGNISVNSDLLTIFCCNPTESGKYLARMKFNFDTTVKLMPGFSVFGGTNLFYTTFITKGNYVPAWDVDGTDTGASGFAGIKVSL